MGRLPSRHLGFQPLAAGPPGAGAGLAEDVRMGDAEQARATAAPSPSPLTHEERLALLEGGMENLYWKQCKIEDRVYRLYAQSRIFTISSQSLENAWLALEARSPA